MNKKAKYMAKLAIDKSLLKEYSNNEYQRTVYMKDGQEFQSEGGGTAREMITKPKGL